MNPRYALNLQTMDACLRADIPVFLWGSPGSGKSSAVRRFAAERGYRLTELTPSILDPTDLLGLPYQSGDGATRFAVPDWLHGILAAPDERHLVFLDELNLASAAVMHACLRLVLERAVHTASLPDGVRFAAAGNDPAQVPTAASLVSPMANRFAHIEWEGLAGEEWLSARTLGWPLPPPLVPSDRDFAPLVAAFVSARPNLGDDHAFADGAAAAEGRAYPTARSWDTLCRALPYGGGDGDLERSVSEAVVGRGAAHEFIAFARASDLPNPKEWLADPRRARPLERDDRTAAALLGVAAEAVRGPRRGNRYAAAIEVFCEMMEKTGRPSLCQPAIRLFLEGAFMEYRRNRGATPRLEAALRRMDGLSADVSRIIDRWRDEESLAEAV